MNRGRHFHGASDRRGIIGRCATSVRRFGHRGAASSRRPRHGRAQGGRVRRLRSPILLFVCGFVLASGTAAFAYTTTSGTGTGTAQAVTLEMPGAGATSQSAATSLTLSWGVSSALPQGGGYLVLRSATPGGPYAKDSSGMCDQTITVVTAATSCVDTGLTAGTTYSYEVEAVYYDVSTLWASAPTAPFSGTTAGAAPAGSGPTGTQPPTGTGAPTITSPSSTTFAVGSADAFQATASGSPAPTFANVAFPGCSPSTLPSGITFSSSGLLSGTPGAGAAGTYTVCIDATNGLSPDDTQQFTLTIATEGLVFSSPPVSGATSGVPNLGPITVRRQSGSGVPITSGGALTVNLTSSPGATFGATQFASTAVTSVTIPSGESAATFWYGSTAIGTITIGAAAPGYASASQQETITAAPAGLGIALAPGSSGSPVVSCGPPSASSTCNVSGVGAGGRVTLSVTFETAGQGPAVYSTTQASTIHETGQSAGSVTVGAGAAGSGPDALTASLGISTLTFGPYSLVVTVGV